jgi:CBS domain-containing protein
MKVEQIMRHDVATCCPDDTLNVAARLMWERDCGSVPVVHDGGKVVAMLTDRDIAMAALTQGRPLHEIRVSSAMSPDLSSCCPNDPVSLALKILQTRQLHRLPVVTGDGELIGMLSLADVAREARREHASSKREVADGQIAEAVEAITLPRSPRREIIAA